MLKIFRNLTIFSLILSIGATAACTKIEDVEDVKSVNYENKSNQAPVEISENSRFKVVGKYYNDNCNNSQLNDQCYSFTIVKDNRFECGGLVIVKNYGIGEKNIAIQPYSAC